MLQFMCFPCRQGVSSSLFYGATLLEEFHDDIRDELYTTTATVGCLPSYLPTTHHATIFQSGVSYHPNHQRNNHPEILSFDYFKLKVRDSIDLIYFSSLASNARTASKLKNNFLYLSISYTLQAI